MPLMEEHNMACAEAYLRTKWHLDSSSRLATTDMGRKLGEFGGSMYVCICMALFLGRGEPGPHQTKYVARAEAYLRANWHFDS